MGHKPIGPVELTHSIPAKITVEAAGLVYVLEGDLVTFQIERRYRWLDPDGEEGDVTESPLDTFGFTIKGEADKIPHITDATSR